MPAQAEPGISPDDLDLEAWGNGRETGFTNDGTAAVGQLPWAPNVEEGFLGFNFDDNPTENDGFLYIPPDPIGAVGEDQVIAVVNTMIESRDKDGDLQWRTSLRNFFAPLEPQTSTFDPKIVYDQYKDRFVVVTLERVDGLGSADPDNESRILLAVSKGDEPEGAGPRHWRYMAIDAKTTVFGFFDGWADYPGFEVDEEAVYVTANIFTFNPFGFYGGNRVWIVPKKGFYNGRNPTSEVYDPEILAGSISLTMQPAQVFGRGGIGGRGSTMGTYLVGYSGLTFGGIGAPEAAQLVAIDDPLGKVGGPFFTNEFVILGDIETTGGPCGFSALADAPQAGTDALIEVNDRRALDAVWRDDALWFVTTIDPTGGCSNDPAAAGVTKAFYVEMDTSGGPGATTLVDGGIIQGVDITGDATTFFPSVAVTRSGEAVFGFSASGADIYAGAFVAGRSPFFPAGVVGPTQTVKAGEDFYLRTFGGPRNRWGDYSGIALDPDDDDEVWVFNMFALPRGTPTAGPFGPEDGRWGTAWGVVELDDDDDSDSDD